MKKDKIIININGENHEFKSFDFQHSNMDIENLSDWDECEFWTKKLLNKQQLGIVNSMHPHWDLDPPQRESYLTPRDYAIGLRDYADRVIESGK